MVTRFRELVNVHVSIEVLNGQKVLRADSTDVPLSISAVGLVNVGQQGALITEGLVAIDALQGRTQTTILGWRAIRVALCDVSLKLLWNIKAFLATTALPGFFQFPILSSGKAGAAAVFAPFMHLHVAMERAGGKEAAATHGALVGLVGGVSFHVDFEVITAREGRVTLPTVVLLVTSV